MASQTLTELMRQAEALTPEEQKQLVAHLVQKGPQAETPVPLPPRRAWREIRGAAAYPLTGEDAQAWVSRTRREDDEERARRYQYRP